MAVSYVIEVHEGDNTRYLKTAAPEHNGDDLTSERDEAFEVGTYEEAERVLRFVRASHPWGLTARITEVRHPDDCGFLVAIRFPTGTVRYLRKGKRSWDTARRESAHDFEDAEAAQEMADIFLKNHREPLTATVEWRGPEKIPTWLKPGSPVRLPGGPTWTILKQVRHEVYLTPPEGGEPVVWTLALFLQVWDLVRPGRFERDAPI